MREEVVAEFSPPPRPPQWVVERRLPAEQEWEIAPRAFGNQESAEETARAFAINGYYSRVKKISFEPVQSIQDKYPVIDTEHREGVGLIKRVQESLEHRTEIEDYG